MKLLFVHGTKIKEDRSGVLTTGGSYNQNVWDRYLSISSDFSVIARKDSQIYEINDTNNKFNYFDTNKIKFIQVPDSTSSLTKFLNVGIKIDINKIIKKAVINTDMVIVRLPSPYGNIAIKYAKKFKKPYLVEVVGCAWDSLFNHSIYGKILALPSFVAMKRSIINAPYAVYVTNEFLQSRYPCNGKKIGCSDVELHPLSDNILEARLNKISKMDKNKAIILGTTATVNVRYKGQEYVIKAISNLNKQGYNFEYHLAGGGDNSYLKYIAKKYNVSDQVKFLGPIPHKEVFEFMENIDIYIQPSLLEGLPRAVIEALSKACPVIGSEVGGIPELISKEFVFKRKDVENLIIKIKKMTNEMLTLDNVYTKLETTDQNTMIIEAKRNFGKAKEYEKDLLDNRRNKFYQIFAEGL